MVKNRKKVPVLTEKLKDLQEERSMTDDEFAELLGLSSDTWTKLKGGRSNYGTKSLQAISERFPELLPYIENIFIPESYSGA